MTTPWVATCDALNPQPAPFDHPVLEDGFFRILGASGRVPTTRRKQGRNQVLVKQNWKDGDLAKYRFHADEV